MAGVDRDLFYMDKYLYLQIIVTECCRREMSVGNLSYPPTPAYKVMQSTRDEVYVISQLLQLTLFCNLGV